MPTKFCYTSISSILLAINPYEYLPIYGDDVIQQFQKSAATGRLPTDRPHRSVSIYIPLHFIDTVSVY